MNASAWLLMITLIFLLVVILIVAKLIKWRRETREWREQTLRLLAEQRPSETHDKPG